VATSKVDLVEVATKEVGLVATNKVDLVEMVTKVVGLGHHMRLHQPVLQPQHQVVASATASTTW